ncbi:MAG: hypothetical protein GEEBNDBF_02451 [bacterium]|nr:hypothetical protein [bacterium]
MEVRFQSHKLQKQCESDAQRVRKYGPEQAQELQKRLDDLEAAESLADFGQRPGFTPLPGRCHPLTNRDHELSLNLKHPYRLILRPDHDPQPLRADGSLDWSRVTKVLILRIEDTHDS